MHKSEDVISTKKDHTAHKLYVCGPISIYASNLHPTLYRGKEIVTGRQNYFAAWNLASTTSQFTTFQNAAM